MIILTNFAESLKELMLERKIDVVKLSKEIGVHENSIYRYLAGTVLPSLNISLKLADFFQCSLEFLFSRTESNNLYANNPMPSFSKRLQFLFDYFKSNEYKLHKGAKISRSITYGWLYKNAVPTLENLAKIADFYGCTIDFVIGREN